MASELSRLREENKYLRDSKMALIKSTAFEIERLRQLINVLANALRGNGFTTAAIRQIGISAFSSAAQTKPLRKSKSPKPKKKEWKYKQKLKTPEPNTSSSETAANIKSNWYSKDSISNSSQDKEPSSQPKSLKERMNALKHNSTTSTSNIKMEALKRERGLSKVKVTTSSKEHISSLFADKIEKQKSSANAAAISGSKWKLLKQALANPDPEKAAEVVESLGLFMAREQTPNFKKGSDKIDEPERRLEVLNLNNNAMMSKMSDLERDNMENLIVDAMVKQEGLEQVQMCNANVNDAFLTKILTKLAEDNGHRVKELWLESNPIGDGGMKQLARFIETDDRIEIIKLYNNKKTISTGVLNEVLDALNQNKTITKFVFDGFRFQDMRDRKERYLRRNQEITRKRRNEERKRLKAMQQ